LNKKNTFFYGLKTTGKTTFIKKELLDDDTFYIDFNSIFSTKDLLLKLLKTDNISKDIEDIFTYTIKELTKKSESKSFMIIFDNFNYIEQIQKNLIFLIKDILLIKNIKVIFSLNEIKSKDIFINPKCLLYRFADEIEYIGIDKDEINNTDKELAEELNFNPFYMDICLNYICSNSKEIALNKTYDFLKYYFEMELNILRGKKVSSDILFYIANEKNVYNEVKKNHNLAKPHTKKQLNFLENLGLIIQEQSYKSYVCRDKLLQKYILENFSK